MADSFAERIRKSSNLHKSRVVLALDPSQTKKSDLLGFAKDTINMLSDEICAIKLNFHILLPLDLYSEVKVITDLAHSLGLQTIADIKLNDISDTNAVALSHLWSAGFDAVIMNPFIGFDALRDAVANAHKNGNGIVALVYMSHKSASDTYGLKVMDSKNITKHIYELFLDWVADLGADGMVVGATLPEIIKQCSDRVKGRIAIFSPGVGVQGGDPQKAIANGSDYLIVGRSIVETKDPKKEASRMRQLTWE